MDKGLKRYLWITGGAAVGFPVFVILHNLFYAFGEMSKDIAPLHYTMEVLHAAFFIVAVIVCPVIFLIGLVGTVVKLVRKS